MMQKGTMLVLNRFKNLGEGGGGKEVHGMNK